MSDSEDRLDKISLLLAMGEAYNSLPRKTSATKALEQAFDLAVLPGVPVPLRDRAARLLMRHYYGKMDDPVSGDAMLADYAVWQYNTQPTTDSAEIFFLPEPVYPKAAVKAGLEGWVVLEFTVIESGAVTDVVVAEASIPDVFDNAAKKTQRRFRYIPRVFEGSAVRQTGVKNRMTFELAN